MHHADPKIVPAIITVILIAFSFYLSLSRVSICGLPSGSIVYGRGYMQVPYLQIRSTPQVQYLGLDMTVYYSGVISEINSTLANFAGKKL